MLYFGRIPSSYINDQKELIFIIQYTHTCILSNIKLECDPSFKMNNNHSDFILLLKLTPDQWAPKYFSALLDSIHSLAGNIAKFSLS